MPFLKPAALTLSVLAIPIILLYMLKLRRREQIISSTLLWLDLVKDRHANAPWQRLRRNILLILQLLILAALVTGVARPYLVSNASSGGNLIVLLDSSASMQAMDGIGGNSRFDDAKSNIRRLIVNLNNRDKMTLISVGEIPVVLAGVTSDQQFLQQALEKARPENNAADWVAAFSLVNATIQGFAEPHIILLSDGSLPENLPSLAGNTTFIAVGEHDANLAISVLSVRPSENTKDLLVSVTNKGRSNGEALLILSIDNMLFESRRVQVAPEQVISQVWSLPIDSTLIEARLEPPTDTADYLAVDNLAWAISEGQTARRALFISDGNLFLERLFTVMPGYTLIHSDPSGLEQLIADGQSFDLYIFDGVSVPDPPPSGSLLIINPQPAGEVEVKDSLIQPIGVFTNTMVVYQADSPLLADVDWRAIHVAEAQNIASIGLTPLVTGADGPLMLAGEIGGHRSVVLPFDLHQTDLPLQIAFPVLMANIVDWLNPGKIMVTENNLQPGSVVVLMPDARISSMTLTFPDGSWKEISNWEQGKPIFFQDTQQVGIYTLKAHDGSESIRTERFAINFFNPSESRIEPSGTIIIGQEEIASDESKFLGKREIWPYLLAAGLVLLLIEWWLTYRRGR